MDGPLRLPAALQDRYAVSSAGARRASLRVEGHSGATVTDNGGEEAPTGGGGEGLEWKSQGCRCAGQSEVGPGEGVVTVVEVDDGGVPGHAGVKVGHQRGDVLRGCEHPMDHITRVDEP